MEFKPDDLIFDLEIRGDFFVVSQYYPQPDRLVVSFMEQMKDPVNNHDGKNNTQSYRYNAEHPELSQVTTNPHALEVFKHDIIKTATHYKNTDIQFENLNKFDDFIKFAKRYGYTKDGMTPQDRLQFNDFSIMFDTDTNFDENKYGLRIGYNSQNYDQTLISAYLADIMEPIITKTAKGDMENAKLSFISATVAQDEGANDKGDPSQLSMINQEMFDEVSKGKGHYMNNILSYNSPANNTYRAWKQSNRFVDVSDMNPKHISLKRCAMALGYKIQESSSNRDPNEPLRTLDNMAEVVAYNANDVYVTMKLFESDTYANRFEQNKQLLKEFPYLTYDQTQEAQSDPNVKSKLAYIKDPNHVRQDRLTVNSTSAKFVENVIAPYTNTKIKDNPTLNLIYPGPDIIKRFQEEGKLPKHFNNHPRNMLDYVQDLLNDDYKNVDKHTAQQVQEQFEQIKNFYSQLIGHNFNSEMDPTKFGEKDNNITAAEHEDYVFSQKLQAEFNRKHPKAPNKFKQRINDGVTTLISNLNKIKDSTFERLFGNPREVFDQYQPNYSYITASNLDNYLSVMFNKTKDKNARMKKILNFTTGASYIDKHGNIKKLKIKHIVDPKSINPEHFEQLHIMYYDSPFKPVEKPKDVTNGLGGILVPYITPKGIYTDSHNVALKSYIVISIGGAHGVEVLYSPYAHDYQQYLDEKKLQTDTVDWFNQLSNDEYKKLFKADRPDDFHVTLDTLAETIAQMMPDGPYTAVKRKELPFNTDHTFGDLLPKSGSRKNPKLKKIKEPALFEGTKVAKNYAYTSSDPSNHEDFDSYYPSLISNLEIFKNADGYDVFTNDLYHPRLHLKKIAKGKITTKDDGTPYTKDEIASAALRQLSMKLLINSASGAGDATFSSKIKCNNKMLAMRILGQIFCWYIGQRLSMAGARVPSTNTDGLYTMNIDKELNNKIVKECAAKLLLGIGPEFLPLFVSKDANNRLEKSTYATVASARGASLTSWQGPSTDNAIDHPAIVDYVLAQYLARVDDAVNKPFDHDAAEQYMNEFINEPPKFAKTIADQLRFFQMPIVSKPDTATFAYTVKIHHKVDKDGNEQTVLSKPVLRNPTNRVFLIKNNDKNEPTLLRMTGLQVVRNSTVNKRIKEAQASGTSVKKSEATFRDIIRVDHNANFVMKANYGSDNPIYNKLYNGYYDPKATNTSDKPRDITNKKVSNLDPDQPIMIFNDDLHDMPQNGYDALIKSDPRRKDKAPLIDFDAYLDIIKDKFEGQWQNTFVVEKEQAKQN